MTLRQPHQDAIVPGEDITRIRQALAACSNLLAWAGAHGGEDFQMAVIQASERAGHCRAPGAMYAEVSLAIDLLDFAPARSTR